MTEGPSINNALEYSIYQYGALAGQFSQEETGLGVAMTKKSLEHLVDDLATADPTAKERYLPYLTGSFEDPQAILRFGKIAGDLYQKKRGRLTLSELFAHYASTKAGTLLGSEGQQRMAMLISRFGEGKSLDKIKEEAAHYGSIAKFVGTEFSDEEKKAAKEKAAQYKQLTDAFDTFEGTKISAMGEAVQKEVMKEQEKKQYKQIVDALPPLAH